VTTQDLTLNLERTYAASPERVFDAWTSEEVLRRWFHGQRTWDTPEARVDLRVGGELRVVMRNPETGDEYGGGGRYTEIDRPRRLVFTWLWDRNDIRTLIQLDFTPTGDGGTHVAFTHTGLWDEEAVRDHRSGWTTCFDNLADALAAESSANRR
jgi:uncharacterized protein YndB with AHSA1/START domain